MSQHIIVESSWKKSFFAILPFCLLIGAVLGSALAVSYGVFEYRESFKAMQKLRQVRSDLNLDWEKLLLEKQTHGAPTEIGGRAVLTLHMYSPPASETATLSATPVESEVGSITASASSASHDTLNGY